MDFGHFSVGLEENAGHFKIKMARLKDVYQDFNIRPLKLRLSVTNINHSLTIHLLQNLLFFVNISLYVKNKGRRRLL